MAASNVTLQPAQTAVSLTNSITRYVRPIVPLSITAPLAVLTPTPQSSVSTAHEVLFLTPPGNCAFLNVVMAFPSFLKNVMTAISKTKTAVPLCVQSKPIFPAILQ